MGFGAGGEGGYSFGYLEVGRGFSFVRFASSFRRAVSREVLCWFIVAKNEVLGFTGVKVMRIGGRKRFKSRI